MNTPAVPYVRKDTTIGIWDIRYLVTYNFLDSRSINDVKARGVRVTGIKRFDTEVKHELVRAWLTINQMVDFYKRGIAVGIVNRSDIVKIYEAIQDHLFEAISATRQSINIPVKLLEDLVDLDKFAKAVYEHAKYDFTQKEEVSDFLRMVGKTQAKVFNSSLFMTPAHDATTTLDKISEQQYDSNEDWLNEKLNFIQNNFNS